MIIGRMLQWLINYSLENDYRTGPVSRRLYYSLGLHNLSRQGCQEKIDFLSSFRLHGILFWAMPSPMKAEESFENHFAPQRSRNGHNTKTSD